MLNKAMLIGNVGKDPEISTYGDGNNVARLSLATSEKRTDKTTGAVTNVTQWHNVVAFGKLAEIIEKYVKKGSKLYVEGQIRYEDYTDKEGVKKTFTRIYADVVRMLDSKRDDEQAATPAATSPAPFADGLPW